MEARRDPEQTRKTFRMVAIAAGIWFLGSGIWGLVTETPEDRAISGCEAAARARIGDAGAGVQHTGSREDQVGWSVTGEVRQDVDGAVVTTVQWTCTTNAEGRNPELTAWTATG